MAVHIIKSMAFTPYHQVVSFVNKPDNTSEVEVVQWFDLDMHPTSGEISYASKENDAGTSYTINVAARLKNPIKQYRYGLLKIELCSGKELIVGTPDVPVSMLESSNLNLTRLNLTHNAIDPPYELITS